MNFFNTMVIIVSLTTGIISCDELIFPKDQLMMSENILDLRNMKTNCIWNIKRKESSQEKVEENDDVICPDEGSALLPDKENCNQFWQCSDGWKYHLTCPPKLWFNSNQNICDYVWNHPLRQGCADPRCPVGSTDLLPVHGDCTKYIQCRNGYAYLLSCCSDVNERDCSVCHFDDVNIQCVTVVGNNTNL